MKENNQLEEVLEQEENFEYAEILDKEECIEDVEENSNEVYEYENYDYITNTKPLGRLIFLVAFTAIMLISSTYAWFSTQKNVTISGLKGKVNVAEGLQMSLDAEHWVNTINFDHFNQPTDGSGWTVKADSPTTYLNNGATFQAPATGVTNVVPEEYKPVSTTGRTNEGIGKTSLIMYNGEYTETEGLNGIDVAAEERESGYYAFDLFLMNTSAEDKTKDVLKLDTNSIVTGINSATGIQNTMRVALALYENNNADEDFDAATAPAGTNMAIDGANALTPAQIIAGTSTDKNISDVAIWEPNADAHVPQIISSTANSIKFSVADRTKYAHLGTSYDANTGISKFADGDLLPTYGITADSAASPSSIENVYDWATPGRGLKKQYTLQTKANETRTEVIDLLSIKKLEANENATDKSFEIVANQYQKVRVYVWIEGQDPDCINYASLGQGLELTLGITKGDDANVAEDTTGPYLPTGFSWANTEHTEILDPSNNQYVWVSVPRDATVYNDLDDNAEDTGMSDTSNEDILNFDVNKLTTANLEAIETELKEYTATYRNGTSYKDEFYSTAQHGFADADAYDAHKDKMLESVFQHGGFYVGKYETGIADSEPDVIDTTVEARTASGDATQTPVIQANAYPYNFVTNKQAQELASTKFNGGGYTTSLMFGLQWDLVLKHLEVSNEATVDELNSDSTEWGNYSNNTTYSTNANAKYYTSSTWTDGLYNKTAGGSVLLSTGASTEFVRGGIYDLAGNVYEWTLEYTSDTYYPCASRGGNYYIYGSDYPASYRHGNSPSYASRLNGFRVSLF